MQLGAWEVTPCSFMSATSKLRKSSSMLFARLEIANTDRRTLKWWRQSASVRRSTGQHVGGWPAN